MRIWKKLCAGVMAGVVCLGSLPVMVMDAGAETQTLGVLTYTVQEDGTITITDCDETATEVEIPAEIDGMAVTKIGDAAFYACTSMTAVHIPDSVFTIGNEAFYKCSSLTAITIPDSVATVGGGVFFSCENLQSVELSNQMTELPFYYEADTLAYCGFFAGCSSLTEITLPNSMTSIGSAAFYSCTKLNTVTMSENVTSIERWAFEDCHALASITLPPNVTSIGDRAFVSCYSLASINIPDKVESIGVHAFHNCEGLTAIQIPASVTSIGDQAFGFCDNLTAITVSPDNPVYASYDGVLYDKALENIIEVPGGIQQCVISDGVTEINSTAFYMHLKLESVTIPESVTRIGYDAFTKTALSSNQTGVKYADSWVIDCTVDVSAVEWRTGTTGIADFAFQNCAFLTSVVVPDGVIHVGTGAFSDCINLTDAAIPDGVTSVAKNLFDACAKLDSVTLPGSVTLVGENAFYQCNALSDVYFDGTKEMWDAIVVEDGNDSLKCATIHFSDGTVQQGIAQGDIDGDTTITMQDAYQALLGSSRVSAGQAHGLTDAQFAAADVDGDGKLTMTDAYWILMYVSYRSAGNEKSWEELIL